VTGKRLLEEGAVGRGLGDRAHEGAAGWVHEVVDLAVNVPRMTSLPLMCPRKNSSVTETGCTLTTAKSKQPQ
jgi:hypothetical protein